MVGVSASVNLLWHHKVQKFSSGTGSPGWSQKRAVKRLCVCNYQDLTLVTYYKRELKIQLIKITDTETTTTTSIYWHFLQDNLGKPAPER